ncbi:Uncharacterised protein [Candidatus Tiddalikarchaeum anstoanum]|nr:Uncharacterised protein [Candidatus Tiddalikarchaeum anstoanum]
MEELEQKLKQVRCEIESYKSSEYINNLNKEEKCLKLQLGLLKQNEFYKRRQNSFGEKYSKYEMLGDFLRCGRKVLIDDVETFVEANIPGYEKEVLDMKLLLDLVKNDEITLSDSNNAFKKLPRYGFHIYFWKSDNETYEKVLVLELDHDEGDALSHGYTERRTVNILKKGVEKKCQSKMNQNSI